MTGLPLSHIPLFAGLDGAAQQALLARMTRRTAACNEIVFWMGDPGTALFIVNAGPVAITVPDERGDHITLQVLGPGGVFGEISLLDGGPRTATARAVSDVIATIAASQAFTLIHIGWFGTWITMNVLAAAGLLPPRLGFDPYPFGLLTLIVSLEAIFLSIFVLVSQNRQVERDRIRTDVDHQVNVKAHLEIMGIVQRLERIERAVKERPQGM